MTNRWDHLPPDTWQTADGRRLAVTTMVDNHLRNTVLYLRRDTLSAIASELRAAQQCLQMLQGEYATYYCEQDISRLSEQLGNVDEYLSDHCPPYAAMLEECSRRNILLPDPLEELHG